MDEHQRILLFDIDGTLMDSTGEGRTCFRQALLEVYGVAGPIESYDMAGKTDWQILNDLLQMGSVAMETVEAKRIEAFAAYARCVTMAAPNLRMRLLPGVAALLERIQNESGFILGLVTGNVREAVPPKLRAVGLDPDVFTFGAYGSEHLDRNTLPKLALYRLSQMLGSPVTPQSALIIGDTPRDVDCARHAGMKVLCVATGRFSREVLAEHNPDYLLDDLSDTDRILGIFNQF